MEKYPGMKDEFDYKAVPKKMPSDDVSDFPGFGRGCRELCNLVGGAGKFALEETAASQFEGHTLEITPDIDINRHHRPYMVPNWSPIGPTQSFRGASQGRQLTTCWVDATFALFHLVWLRSSWLLPSSCCMAAVSRGFWEAAAETAAGVTQQPGLCGASHKRAGRRGV